MGWLAGFVVVALKFALLVFRLRLAGGGDKVGFQQAVYFVLRVAHKGDGRGIVVNRG